MWPISRYAAQELIALLARTLKVRWGIYTAVCGDCSGGELFYGVFLTTEDGVKDMEIGTSIGLFFGNSLFQHLRGASIGQSIVVGIMAVLVYLAISRFASYAINKWRS